MADRLAVFLVLFSFFGVPDTRSDDVPFLVTRLDVYLYDENKAPNADYFAGSVDCNYFNRERPNTGSGRYSLGADTKCADNVRIWYQVDLVTA